jgi:hypothetical protein
MDKFVASDKKDNKKVYLE